MAKEILGKSEGLVLVCDNSGYSPTLELVNMTDDTVVMTGFAHDTEKKLGPLIAAAAIIRTQDSTAFDPRLDRSHVDQLVRIRVPYLRGDTRREVHGYGRVYVNTEWNRLFLDPLDDAQAESLSWSWPS